MKFSALFPALVICIVMAPPTHASDRPRIGLALSGGGAKGLAHIGALKVIEEAGLRVDCIAGTSMGAIVGGLYSIGYGAAAIDSIARSLDWDALLTDDVSRRDLSMEEKDEQERYVLSLPIRNGTIGLPRGLVAGQNAAAALSRLTAPAHHIDDFGELPIPFRCVATDIETGEAVTLTGGFLPEALRASMSIPTVLSPVEVNGRLLVDGLLVRNLPAQDVRDMNADIIIGVDVGAQLYKKEELDSLVRIMEQSISLMRAGTSESQRKLCGIIIEPEVDEFSVTAFNRTDSLIVRGERAARKMLPRLRALAEMRSTGTDTRPGLTETAATDTVRIVDIDVEGLENVSRELLFGKLQLEPPASVTTGRIERAVGRVYGTMFFQRVNYRLEPADGGSRLVLHVLERKDDRFRIGVNYDSEMKAAFLLNTTFRNKLGEGSRIKFDTRLGESPYLDGQLFLPTNWKPGISLELETRYRRFDVFTYTPEGRPEANLDYSLVESDILFRTIFSNSFVLGGGARYHYSWISSKIAPDGYTTGDTYGRLNFLAFFRLDTLDRTDYPRSGFSYTAKLISVTDNWLMGQIDVSEPFNQAVFVFNEYLNVFDRITIFGGFYGGLLTSRNVPPDYLFYMGGAHMPGLGGTIIPFMGLNFMEDSGIGAAVNLYGIRFEPWRNRFVSLRMTRGKTVWEVEDLFSSENRRTGFGLSLGALTPLGPVNYTVSWEAKKKDVISHFRLGYTF